MSDEGEILLEDGPDSKRLRVALRQFKGRSLLDLRYWYLDKKTKDMRPSPKGISLTRTNYLGLRSIALDHHDAVMEYLDVGTLSKSHEGDRKQVEERFAHRQQSVSTINVSIEPIRPSTRLYDVRHEGAHAIVVLNALHPLVSDLPESMEDVQPIIEFSAKLLVALDLTISSLTDTEATSPRIIAEQFEFDFPKNARQVARQVT
jgi:hypothetical protein